MVTQTPPNAIDGRKKDSNNSAVEMDHLPKRTASVIARDIMSDTVYKHQEEEEKKKVHQRRLIIGGAVAAGIVLLLIIIIIVVTVTQLRGGPAGPDSAWLTFAPRPNPNLNRIRYREGDNGSYSQYREYVENLQTLLDEYDESKQAGPEYVNCTENGSDEDTVCKFDLRTLGSDCVAGNEFGYSAGNPCVVLKLYPKDGWQPNRITIPLVNVEVVCSHSSPHTIITQTPKTGFPGQYFPYRDEPGYLAPLVMLRFTNVTRNVTINVNCTVTDPNITDTNIYLFQTAFDLRIDQV